MKSTITILAARERRRRLVSALILAITAAAAIAIVLSHLQATILARLAQTLR